MAKDDIIDVEPIEEEKVEEVADEEINVEAEEEIPNTKEAANKIKEDIKDTTDHLKEEASKGKEKVKAEAKESAERFKEDSRRRKEKFDENIDKGKDVAEKVSENLSKTFDDTIIALKAFQKDVDAKYQEYRETSATNKIDVDLIDAEGFYYLQAYIAGVAKEDIDIEATKNSITLKVKFANIFEKIECPEDSKPKFIITAGKKGEAARTIKLTEDIDIEQVSAKHDNGILFITIPKISTPKAKVDIE
ncbi:MAG: Hsp20/alpha crystallin family protein [Methanobrevibacter sp.]|nr:Hsp20/alpha crystallin family protein [Methanobrevibacter sp.]